MYTEKQNIFSKIITLQTINPTDYDATSYSVGYGPLWNLAGIKNSVAMIEEFYNNRPITAVFQGFAVL